VVEQVQIPEFNPQYHKKEKRKEKEEKSSLTRGCWRSVMVGRVHLVQLVSGVVCILLLEIEWLLGQGEYMRIEGCYMCLQEICAILTK
jgi:hypothetical protein